MFEADQKYLNDPTFRAVVDSMVAMLGYYTITPSELRQAAIMAAVEFENRRVPPRYIYMYAGATGAEVKPLSESFVSSMLEEVYGARTGRFQSDKPNFNFTELERMNGQHMFC